LVGLANLSFKDGNDAQGIALLKRVIQLAPQSFEPRYLLASAYNRAEKYNEALAELRVAAHLANDQPEVYYQLARAYGGLGQDEERRKAVSKFEVLSQKAKTDADAHRTTGKLMQQAASLIDAGDLTGALAKMQEAHRLLPSDDKTLFRLAGIEYDLKQYETARNHILAAVDIAPSEWMYHFLLGLIDRELDKLQEAHQSLETAARLNPSAAPVQNALGQLALQQNNPRQAILCFEKAVELNPGQAEYRANLQTARSAESVKR
jgi:tetratricopeptide (TPR) repeat protein